MWSTQHFTSSIFKTFRFRFHKRSRLGDRPSVGDLCIFTKTYKEIVSKLVFINTEVFCSYVRQSQSSLTSFGLRFPFKLNNIKEAFKLIVSIFESFKQLWIFSNNIWYSKQKYSPVSVYRGLLKIACMEHISKDTVVRKMGKGRKLLVKIKNNKKSYLGHVYRRRHYEFLR